MNETSEQRNDDDLHTAALKNDLESGKRAINEQGANPFELDGNGQNIFQKAMALGNDSFIFGMLLVVLVTGLQKTPTLRAFLSRSPLCNPHGEGGSMLDYNIAGALAVAKLLAQCGVSSLLYMGCASGYEAIFMSLLLHHHVTAIERNDKAHHLWDGLARVLENNNPKLLNFLSARIRLVCVDLFNVARVSSNAIFSSQVDGPEIELRIWRLALLGLVEYIATFACQQDGIGLNLAQLKKLGLEVVGSVHVRLSGSQTSKTVRVVHLPSESKAAVFDFLFGAEEEVSPE